MPITPLHFGLMAPVNHFFPNKVSIISFVLINVWMDGSSITYALFGLEYIEPHSPLTHSLLSALVLASIMSWRLFLPGVFMKPKPATLKWALGAYYGGVSHVLLDSLVHFDMVPLYPITVNHFQSVNMATLSLVLLPFTIWFIQQCVSYMLRRPSKI